ncbi:MAG: SAM-dependent methyltransferase [Pseudonocardiaceae bacterium]
MSDTEVPQSDDAVPVFIDTTKSSIARAYDAALGGKDNYEVDREVLRQLRVVAPAISDYAWDFRQLLVRITRFLAGEAGITQFLDCGAGLPTAENTHQVAQRIQPDARVVYVDIDPVVLAHGRALLAENEQTILIEADIFEPNQVLHSEAVQRHLDFSAPIALYHMATFHHYNGQRSSQSIMAEYIDALPSGSYVAISHYWDPETPAELHKLAREMQRVFLNSPMRSGWFRTRAEIEALLPGLELVEPGLVRCADWWPDGPRIKPLDPERLCTLGGVGRKP